MFLSQRLQNGASPYRRSKERTHDRSTAVAFIGDFANEQGSREKLVKSQRIFFGRVNKSRKYQGRQVLLLFFGLRLAFEAGYVSTTDRKQYGPKMRDFLFKMGVIYCGSPGFHVRSRI